MNARSVGFLLALVGLALVAHPLYLFPHHGENLYHLSKVETVGEAPPANETVAYGDLPPVAKERFSAELDGHSDGIWTGEHAAAYEALSDHEYVRYQGDYYEYRFRPVDRLDGLGGILRWVLSALGVIALVVGFFVARTGTYRPLTPVRALWIPVGVFVALVATEVYDVRVGGAFASGGSYVQFYAMLAAFVSTSVVGSAVRDRGSLAPLAPVGLLVLAGTALAVASGYASAVGGGAVAFALVTGPWFALGYGLTASPESE